MELAADFGDGLKAAGIDVAAAFATSRPAATLQVVLANPAQLDDAVVEVRSLLAGKWDQLRLVTVFTFGVGGVPQCRRVLFETVADMLADVGGEPVASPWGELVVAAHVDLLPARVAEVVVAMEPSWPGTITELFGTAEMLTV